jgi:adenylate kinase
VVTGTPGTGKTTFSRLLSGRLGATHVDLSAYALGHGYAAERDEERDTAVVDLGALTASVQTLLEQGGEIILDGHYAHEVTPPGGARMVFVLRRAPWLLHGELLGRGYRAEKVWENLEAEIVGVCLSEALDRFGADHVCSLDTSDTPPEATLMSGLAALEGRGAGDEVDWLGRPETLELLRRRTCTS